MWLMLQNKQYGLIMLYAVLSIYDSSICIYMTIYQELNFCHGQFQELARAYLREAEWRHSKQVPSFQEYLENGMVSSAYDLLVKTGLVGMGEVVTEEALAWHESHPKILQASELIARIHNDVASYKVLNCHILLISHLLVHNILFMSRSYIYNTTYNRAHKDPKRLFPWQFGLVHDYYLP